ncbi:MAG: helicase-exonuclease AddAB subunit AddA [Acetivibrio sp.]
MKWTKDQRKVIETRNRNILVSAAAGSGKTAVLVERIIQIIMDEVHPVDIDHLLIVTFTSAAAGEMRERISLAIEKRLLEEKDNLHLQKQMALIHSAQITTIHSFCLGMIRNYFNQINLDPGFRMGEEAELRLLKSDVLEEVLEMEYEKKEPDFLAFVESYATGKSDSGLEDMVLKLYEFSMSYPWPKEWLQKTKEGFNLESKEELLAAKWMKDLMENIQFILEEAKIDNGKALQICEEGNGPYMYKEAISEDEKIIEQLTSACTYEDLKNLYNQIEWKRLSSKKDATVSVEKREFVKSLRNTIKASIVEIQKQYFFQPLEESLEDIQKVKPAMEALINLTLLFSEQYRIRKAEKNVLDFNDLEHFALEILINEKKPTSVALELSEYYEEILVDEYQDSNFVQETLLNSISKEKFGRPNLFMVGDVKQSIYKFRLAKPELFIAKYKRYEIDGEKEQRINLHKNFRSRDSVIDGINEIFQKIMHTSLGNIEYDEEAALYRGASYPEIQEGSLGKTEIILFDGKEELAEEMTVKEREAQGIVSKIKKMMEEGHVFEKDHHRAIKYGDIVILLRSMRGWAEEFASILCDKGIPAYADTQTGYFSAIEVQEILNLLLIIDNPLQDIPLVSVLKSYIGEFSDAELSQIRVETQEQAFFESLKQYEKNNNQKNNNQKKENKELIKKIVRFLNFLDKMRERVSYMGVYDLIQTIYTETGYYNRMSMLPGGSIRKGNLDMLLQKAKEFEKTSYHGLFHFNRYIEKLHQYDMDFGEAGSGEKMQNAVRIMSIHKSKGLEFPVVFLAGMGKQFNQQDARSRLILHPEMGIGPDYIDYEKRTKVPTLIKKVMQKKIVLENLGEELRVLYVGMTRAKEKLIMTGYVKDLEKKLAIWEHQEGNSFRELCEAGSFLDWVLPCALPLKDTFDIHVSGMEEMVERELANQLSNQEKRKYLLSWNSDKYLPKEEEKDLYKIFEFNYPYQEEQKIKAKISVSELKYKAFEKIEEPGEKLFAEESKERYIPGFAENKEKITGTKRGTLYHKVMQCLSFQRISDVNHLEKEITDLVKTGRISKEEENLLLKDKIWRFFETPIGKRMAAADRRNQLFKEQPFVLGVPARKVNPEIPSEELVIVQGIIDAFFEEDGELVLLDYKTDHVTDKQELVDRYRSQLCYYQEALEQIIGKKVKERIVYSFALGEEIEL